MAATHLELNINISLVVEFEMDGFNKELITIVGVASSNRFKLSFLCTPANLRLMNRNPQISIEELEIFIRNDAMLIAGVLEHTNDDHLYFLSIQMVFVL